MDRRTFLALFALPVVAEVLAACGDRGEEKASPAGVSSLKGSKARVTDPADASMAAAAINAFAADLHDRLAAKDPTANLVFSPASIALALAMTSAGAKGETLTQMDAVLHITDPTAIHRSMNGLSQALEATTKTKSLAAEGGEGTQSVQVSIVNSLWGQKDLAFEQSFLDLLSSEYGAGLELVDYRADAEKARVAINAWVADATKGRIPELLAEGVLTRDSLLTLVNAIYLKANWAEEFFEVQTKPQDFTLAGGSTVSVQMMHTGGEKLYAKGEGWQAAEIDYAFGDLGFVVAMADDGGSVPTGDEVFEQLGTTRVILGLPKFDIGSAVGLATVLREMGMTDAFADADFSGITTAADLFISDVIHQANITVDEKGTEAAAATAVAMAGTAAPTDPPVELTFDRPFTFWLREKATNAILFMGRVNDPSQDRS